MNSVIISHDVYCLDVRYVIFIYFIKNYRESPIKEQ